MRSEVGAGFPEREKDEEEAAEDDHGQELRVAPTLGGTGDEG